MADRSGYVGLVRMDQSDILGLIRCLSVRHSSLVGLIFLVTDRSAKCGLIRYPRIDLTPLFFCILTQIDSPPLWVYAKGMGT